MTAQRHIHLDAVGGIAGDMFVAAIVDAFPALRERVLGDVAAVLPRDAGRAVLAEGMSHGVRALRFGLVTSDATAATHGPHDGSYRELLAHLRNATLSTGTANAANAILTHLAQVEAHIHGVKLEEVHFHELGAWDSLMDVVAAGSIIAALDDACWSISELPLGSGQVSTQHGRLPVPAPATMELLRGFRWRDDGIGGERVTPTGAAIVRHLVAGDHPAPRLRGRLAATGTGAGTRELRDIPNVLRVLVFDPDETHVTHRVAVISFDVDDMTGEEIGVAAERLRREAGVLDVSLETRIGKKGRPMMSFQLLVDPMTLEAVERRCFAETSTIGLRFRFEERVALPREMKTTSTADGSQVRVKHVTQPGGMVTCKAESDDLIAGEDLQARRARKAEAESGPA